MRFTLASDCRNEMAINSIHMTRSDLKYSSRQASVALVVGVVVVYDFTVKPTGPLIGTSTLSDADPTGGEMKNFSVVTQWCNEPVPLWLEVTTAHPGRHPTQSYSIRRTFYAGNLVLP